MSDERRSDVDRGLLRAMPTAQATDRARAAVRAAVVTPPRQRSVRRQVLIGGCASAMLAAGVAIAASGTLPGRQTASMAAPATAGPGVAGEAASAPAVAISPAKRFVAIGTARSLDVTDVAGHLRWRLATSGAVVQIAWAPYPTYIAYVARNRDGYDLRVVWGNGLRDRLVAANVLPQRPVWRSDTGALFYRAADGSAEVWVRSL